MCDINQIIVGCIKNDQRSQTEFYNLFHNNLRRYIVKRMRSDDYVDEILSLTFERAFAKMHLYKGTGSIEGWLKIMVRHCMYDLINKKVKERSTGTVYIEYIAEMGNIYFSDTSSDFHTTDAFSFIKTILAKKEYAVFMAFYEGFSHREIGDKFDISEGTSKWYVSEARRKIQEKIDSGDLVI